MSDTTMPTASLSGYAYATIPEWILDAEISSHAVRLFGVLDRFVGRNENGWPSRDTVAKRMNCSVATVDRSLIELVEIKAISITQRFRKIDGSQTSSSYMTWPACALTPLLTGEEGGSSPVSTALVTGDAAERSNPSEVTPVKTTHLSDSKSSRSYTADFESLWAIYPRKEGKTETAKRVDALVRAGESFGDLICAAANYAQSKNGVEPRYVKMPSRFFSNDLWREWLKGFTTPSPTAAKASATRIDVDVDAQFATEMEELRRHRDEIANRKRAS